MHAYTSLSTTRAHRHSMVTFRDAGISKCLMSNSATVPMESRAREGGPTRSLEPTQHVWLDVMSFPSLESRSELIISTRQSSQTHVFAQNHKNPAAGPLWLNKKKPQFFGLCMIWRSCFPECLYESWIEAWGLNSYFEGVSAKLVSKICNFDPFWVTF